MTALNIGVGIFKPAFCTIYARRSPPSDQHALICSWQLCAAPMAGRGVGLSARYSQNKYVVERRLVSSFEFYFFVTGIGLGQRPAGDRALARYPRERYQ